MRRLHGALAAAADRGPRDFPELLLVPGVGARTVRALAMVAEVIHGAPCRFTDPARFSLAHGGKDRPPLPALRPLRGDHMGARKSAVKKGKRGGEEGLAALGRVAAEARRHERGARGGGGGNLGADERQRSIPMEAGRCSVGRPRPSATHPKAMERPIAANAWRNEDASAGGRMGRAPIMPPTISSLAKPEQLVVLRVVRAGGKAAFQQGRDHVERGQRDHQPHRGAREGADLRQRLPGCELTVEQQHGCEREMATANPMKAQV